MARALGADATRLGGLVEAMAVGSTLAVALALAVVLGGALRGAKLTRCRPLDRQLGAVGAPLTATTSPGLTTTASLGGGCTSGGGEAERGRRLARRRAAWTCSTPAPACTPTRPRDVLGLAGSLPCRVPARSAALAAGTRAAVTTDALPARRLGVWVVSTLDESGPSFTPPCNAGCPGPRGASLAV